VTIIEHDCRQGVLAFGDSITNGGGELQWGVALQSWALWVARALGLPFTSYAFDGARAADVVGTQIPAHRRISARPEARYELGCVYIGVNDVRGFDWDPGAYERDLTTALTYLRQRCDALLSVTIPHDLGRPPAGSKVREANAIVERAAAAQRALIVDLRDFGGHNHLMPDHVHPTAFGQIEIAERALGVLSQTGLTPAVEPKDLISWKVSWKQRVRSDLRYGRRYAKVLWDAQRAARRLR
jgi:lysophospholipase L1-like esterase